MAIIMLKSAPKKAVKTAVKKVTKKPVKKVTKKAVKKVTKKTPAKKISKVGKMYQVLKGTRVRTAGGLKAADLTKNKHGKVVSKKATAHGKKNVWNKAFVAARKALKIQGFCPVGGKSAQGKALLAKCRELYSKM